MSGLKCLGVWRDAENDKALNFYFNRPVTDDEMRYLHEVMRRATMCSPFSNDPTDPNVPEGARLRVVKP